MPRLLIYGLVDPRTMLVRYIGQSSRGVYRAHEHRYAIGRGCTYKDKWIRSLLALGLDYTIVVLEESPADLVHAERWWIAYGRACGWPLTNLTDGGDGAVGCVASKEAREKMAAAKRGTRRGPPSAQTRERIARALRGKPKSPETRAKIIAARKSARDGTV